MDAAFAAAVRFRSSRRRWSPLDSIVCRFTSSLLWHALATSFAVLSSTRDHGNAPFSRMWKSVA